MLVTCLLETARRSPDSIAVKDPFRQLTFAQLAAFAQTMRGIVLKETQNPHVGVMLPCSAAGMGTIMGILWAGRTFIPLNFLLQPRELTRIVQDAGLDLIISTAYFEELLAQVPVRAVFLEKLGLKRRYLFSKLQRTPEPPERAPDDVAGIIYTSGTSGQPKGVCLTENNFLSNAKAAIEHLGIEPDDRLLGVLPTFHVFGLTFLTFVPGIQGASVVCVPRFSPQEVVKTIAADRTNILLAVPSMYGAVARLKNLGPADFRHIKIAVSGGEALPRKTYHGVLERTGMRIMEGYGLTETSPAVSADRPWDHVTGTVGRPLPGVETLTCHLDGQVLQPGEEGELHVRGPLIMKGYYNKPEETAAVIDRDGWFRTGDIVRIEADGHIRITGRAKDLIIVAGENVYPREIEEVLDLHPAVAEAAVIGRTDGVRGEMVVGFVTLREGCAASNQDLRAFCREHLAGFKVPREIHIRPELPHGPTGKVLKRELPALLVS